MKKFVIFFAGKNGGLEGYRLSAETAKLALHEFIRVKPNEKPVYLFEVEEEYRVTFDFLLQKK